LNDAFYNLDKEKQERILNAALVEFSKKGYKNASTNEIVKEAEIGKGMLFYYFNTKHDLYEYLIKHSIVFIKNNYVAEIDFDEPDFIKRMKSMAHAKFNAMNRNEHIFNFIAGVSLNERSHVNHILIEEMDSLSQRLLKNMYDNLDMSYFKKDIPKEVVLRFISWIIEGYQNELINKLKGVSLEEVDMDPYWREFDYYLEMIRVILYK